MSNVGAAHDVDARVTLADIVAARSRIASGVVRTPCAHSAALSQITGCDVFVKLEYQQRTGSFKERGARNAMLQLSAAERSAGVVAASAGNHALALAWHGRDLNIPVTVVMPKVAPLVKQARCRELGVKWFGNDAKRSDVLALNFVLIDPGNAEYGMDWDGNCHSLEVKYLGIVGGKGMVIRNTSGSATTYPAIGRIGHIETDYSTTHGIDIQAGLDYDFVMPYVLGSAGDGFRIAATINAYEVRITGGKTVGNTGYGINNLGGAVLVSGSLAAYTNAAGNYNGSVWCMAPRFVADTYCYLQVVGTTPTLSVDDTDYISYDRSANQYNFQVAGAGIFSIGAAYSQAFAPIVMRIYTVATLPAGTNGMRAMVSDSSVTTFNSAVAGGGGALVPVFYAGSWKVG